MTSVAPTALDLQRVARLWRAAVGETMFPPRAPFFRPPLTPRGAAIAAQGEEEDRGNLTVSPDAPSLALEIS